MTSTQSEAWCCLDARQPQPINLALLDYTIALHLQQHINTLSSLMVSTISQQVKHDTLEQKTLRIVASMLFQLTKSTEMVKG